MVDLRELPTLEAHIVDCVSQEVYDPEIYSKYSLEEIRKADGFIDHGRDFLIHLCWFETSCR